MVQRVRVQKVPSGRDEYLIYLLFVSDMKQQQRRQQQRQGRQDEWSKDKDQQR